RTTPRIGLGNYWRSHHARHHDSVRHRFGAAVSFLSVHLWSFPADHRSAHAFLETSGARLQGNACDAVLSPDSSDHPRISQPRLQSARGWTLDVNAACSDHDCD